jgi:hypothetical protein
MAKVAVSLIAAMSILPLMSGLVHAASPAATPQMRTYVSGSGSDSNQCSVSSPCKTFQGALNRTLPSGEIYVLNSANYGQVTINKAVTITSEGAVAGVLASSGVGITISAGPSDVINLRGLDIDGGNTGLVGVQFNSGQALNMQKSVVRGFTNSGIVFGPNSAGMLFVSDTALTNNATNGLLIKSTGSGAVNGSLTRVTASGNGVGILANGANVNLTLTDAVAGNNNYGVGSSLAAVMVRNSTVTNNAVGIAADQGSIIRVTQSTLTANGTGWRSTNGGMVQSYGNNNVGGNTTDGTVTSTLALQ